MQNRVRGSVFERDTLGRIILPDPRTQGSVPALEAGSAGHLRPLDRPQLQQLTPLTNGPREPETLVGTSRRTLEWPRSHSVRTGDDAQDMSPSDSPDTSLDERSFQIHCGRCGVAIQNGPEISRTSDPWFQCACKTPVVKYGETSSSYYLSYPARVKEKRRRASPEQVAALESAYSNNAFPDSTERVALAERLCMSARSVQIWFQNKRRHHRVKGLKSSSSTSSQRPWEI